MSYHATVRDFRDLDLMFKIADNTNGRGILATELSELVGFDAEDGARAIGGRLRWMRHFGMVVYDDKEHLWKLSRGGERVVDAQLRAGQIRKVAELPDESMVEIMAHVTSRFRHGVKTKDGTMLGEMIRREFIFNIEGQRRR